MIAEALLSKGYPMLIEEPAHCALSMLSVCSSLYEARTRIAKLEAVLNARVPDVKSDVTKRRKQGPV